MDENTIICRCSDVTLKEIRDLIKQGYDTFDEIKRITRVGMGPCQGRTCTPLVLKEIANITGKPLSEIMPGTFRPPVKSIKLGEISDNYLDGGDIDD